LKLGDFMDAVMETMPHDYNLILVALSYVISVLGSFTALKLCRQHAGARGAEKWRSLLAGALAMGAGAIWSMHFIAMLAFDMGMPVAYDVPITLASLLVAVAVTGLGIYVVGKGPTSPWRLIGGGTAMGVGVAAMHYTGMAAMRMQAHLDYNLVIRGHLAGHSRWWRRSPPCGWSSTPPACGRSSPAPW
jgi:NO-binding membrane sensor protein with MHYT domain